MNNPELIRIRDREEEKNPLLSEANRLKKFQFLSESRDAILAHFSIPVDANFSPGVLEITRSATSGHYLMSLTNELGDLKISQTIQMNNKRSLWVTIEYGQVQNRLLLTQTRKKPREGFVDVVTIDNSNYFIKPLR